MKNTFTKNKMQPKELIDQVSIFGDQKDFSNQVQLFTENALSETRVNGKVVMQLKGRKAMAKAFAEFLKEIDTVSHFNGQSLFTVEGDEATGICYCLITMISNDTSKKTKTTIRAVYNDYYVRHGHHWLIEKRIGNFLWQDKCEIHSAE
ncbi:nuclear transport factor 2 family protein [Chryseobacterium sp. SSA4.19]|uniref:nuclear transport factor 2 family protein n=1 Tax=Chryseobacterium sp. SSA4.19 TaxID=2919915 RepID=UPI001F4E8CF6|nr:nuclear transport factor 2 family protein [Chryseobacterium sp. SSA4.19]MCJ8152637.1 nuclear transport factor 2 family protein [Chryseobacterium sp. SSA4.19]